MTGPTQWAKTCLSTVENTADTFIIYTSSLVPRPSSERERGKEDEANTLAVLAGSPCFP